MKKVIVILFLIFSFFARDYVLAEDRQKVYHISILFDQGNATIGEVSTNEGYVQNEDLIEFSQGFKYRLELLSQKGELLEKKQFSIDNRVFPAPPDEGRGWEELPPVIQDQLEHFESLLYHKNGAKLFLFNSNNKLISQKDVAYLADFCGDKKCGAEENFENCSEDCVKNEKPERPNEQKAECSGSACDIQQSSKNNVFVIIMLVVFFMVLLGAVIFVIIKRKKR